VGGSREKATGSPTLLTERDSLRRRVAAWSKNTESFKGGYVREKKAKTFRTSHEGQKRARGIRVKERVTRKRKKELIAAW